MGDHKAHAVLAVIPTFKPDTNLKELIEALEPQVSGVVVSDDASPCSFDPLLRAVGSMPGVTVIRHSRNRGIARGLNDGLNHAQSDDNGWLLTVDQDSLVPPNYVEHLLNGLNSPPRLVAAIGAERVADTAGDLSYPLTATEHGPVTEELIQTGTLWSVSALTSIGGFDETLGIDAVDAAACLRLRERHHQLAVAPGLSITHSLGSAQMVSVLGRQVMLTGHSPARRTSMLRNRLRLFPAEFRQSPRHALRTLRRVGVNQLLGLTGESGRMSKAAASLRALFPTDPT